MTNNPFLQQLKDLEIEIPSEENEEEIYSTNPFLMQLPKIEKVKKEKIELPFSLQKPVAQEVKHYNRHPTFIEKLTPKPHKPEESFNDYLENAKRQAEQQEYETQTALGKRFLKGLTLGASEYVPGLKPEGEFPGGSIAELLGEVTPIGGISKLVKFIPRVSKNLPKAIKLAEDLSRTALTGATFKGAQEAIKGEIPGKETAKTAAEFAGVHAFLSLLGTGGRYLSNLIKNLPSKEAELIEKKFIGHEKIPKSIFETSENLLNELQSAESAAIEESKAKEAFFPKEILKEKASEESPSLIGRVKLSDEQLGIHIPKAEPNKTLDNEIGNIFSKKTFKNSTVGGKTQKSAIQSLDEQVYKDVNDKYQKSRELNSTISEIHPELVSTLQNRLSDLEIIPSPSGPQKELISSIKSIIKSLAQEQDGQISGYIPINNQTLIDQIQSLRQKIDYDFAHGNARNIFKPIISDLQNAVESAAIRSGNDAAIESNISARKSYKNWVEKFDTPYIRPFRDRSNKDYSKTYKSSLDIDEYNEIASVLKDSPNGNEILDVMKRDLVNKNLEKFYDKPLQTSLKDFDKALNELEAVITPQESQKIRTDFIKFKQKITPKFKAVNRLKQAEETNNKFIAKYLDKKPEDITHQWNSRSGIKQLKKDVENIPKAKERFDVGKKQKIQDIFREGNIEKEFNGDDLYKVLNNRNNFEILSELIGEEETEAARQAAKLIGKKQIKLESAQNVVKKAAFAKFLHTIWPLVIS